MELLASVHWVAVHEHGVHSLSDAVAAVHGWNDRKRTLMTTQHIASAWHRLEQEGWLTRSCDEPLPGPIAVRQLAQVITGANTRVSKEAETR
jgi:hypothetical protein